MNPALPWATAQFGLRLNDHAPAGDYRLSTLVQPGLRRNPRRAHLLVSTVLGKHIAVSPDIVREAGTRLGDAVTALNIGAADVLGMAETATSLGHCVADRLGAEVYLHSTRRPAPADHVFAEFQEGHSHATDHLLQPAGTSVFRHERPLVIVDDEISTGRTALASIDALHRRWPRKRYVVASLVDVRAADHRRLAQLTSDTCGVPIDFVSLADGEVTLPEGLTERVCALPDPRLNPTYPGLRGTYRTVQLSWPEVVPAGGRHGFLLTDTPAFDAAVAVAVAELGAQLDRGRSLLVVGHEELMYLPLRIAELLATQGFDTRFQSTTRSPAHVLDHPGYPLRCGFEFPATEADATGTRYFYNGWPDEPDGARVQLMVVLEATASPGAAGLAEVLTAAGYDVLLVVVTSPGFEALAAARDRP